MFEKILNWVGIFVFIYVIEITQTAWRLLYNGREVGSGIFKQALNEATISMFVAVCVFLCLWTSYKISRWILKSIKLVVFKIIG